MRVSDGNFRGCFLPFAKPRCSSPLLVVVSTRKRSLLKGLLLCLVVVSSSCDIPLAFLSCSGYVAQSLEREASAFEARLDSARADLQKADRVRDSLDRMREQDEVKRRPQ